MYLPAHSGIKPTHFIEYSTPCPVSISFTSFSTYMVGACQLPCTYPQTFNVSSFPPHILPLKCFSLSPHPTPQSLGLICIRHAVGDKVRPTRGPVILASRHCPVSQHRHTPSNPPPRFVPPALGPHGKQSPGQTLHAQT